MPTCNTLYLGPDMIKKTLTLAISMIAMVLAVPALGSTPTLVKILPRGGQRGTEVELNFYGQRLNDVQVGRTLPRTALPVTGTGVS